MTVNVTINPVNEKEFVKEDIKAKSIQRAALFAGGLYLIINVAAIVAHIFLPSQIIVEGDATIYRMNHSKIEIN